MAAIRSVSTKPELKLRRALWRLGFRYRVNEKRLPGSPDVVLPKYRTVIFIHGCFWHGHNGCKYYTIPKTNTDFWTAKIKRNQERDQEVWRRLEAMGWEIIIVWECQLKKDVIEDTVSHVMSEIFHNGERYLQIKQDRKVSRLTYILERRAHKEKEAACLSELNR
jgi:DNA mismatch endonuclease (patch repair protein)